MTLLPALPLMLRATLTTVSVQIALPRSIGVVLTTVPSTITGDFAMSCSSSGMTIVVADSEPARIIKTHDNPYALKCFKKNLLINGRTSTAVRRRAHRRDAGATLWKLDDLRNGTEPLSEAIPNVDSGLASYVCASRAYSSR